MVLLGLNGGLGPRKCGGLLETDVSGAHIDTKRRKTSERRGGEEGGCRMTLSSSLSCEAAAAARPAREPDLTFGGYSCQESGRGGQ